MGTRLKPIKFPDDFKYHDRSNIPPEIEKLIRLTLKNDSFQLPKHHWVFKQNGIEISVISGTLDFASEKPIYEMWDKAEPNPRRNLTAADINEYLENNTTLHRPPANLWSKFSKFSLN
jgi:hypothetical protein